MTDPRDVQTLIASSVAKQLPEGFQVGMDDHHTFIRAGGDVFRVQVELIAQISKRPDADDQAEQFMLTLPYGPGL